MKESNPNHENEITPSSARQARANSIALFSYDDEDALSVLRILGPAKVAGLKVFRGYDFADGKVHIDVIDKADLVIIQREFSRDYDTYTKLISLSRLQKKPVIIDLDDNIFVLPLDHPDRIMGFYSYALLPTLQAVMDVDLVTVTTKPLRNFLLPYNPNIRIIPNYLDDSIWKIASPPAPHKEDSDTITIGYMAGQTHMPDLQMVTPVLKRLVEKYPNRISFHFWGMEAPIELAQNSKSEWYPPVFFRYEEFATAFQAQYADIMIAPLCDNLFNSCKSAIKYLEYSAFGVPGVYSRVTPYIDIIENGKDGLLATNPDEWMGMLIKLIESPELRRDIVINAQQKIRKHWLLSKNITKRIKIYEDAVLNYQPKEEPSYSFYNLERSLAQQYYEEHQRQKVQHNTLMVQLTSDEEKLVTSNAYIKELENEVLSYVTSHSWQLTRPFRKLMRYINRLKHV